MWIICLSLFAITCQAGTIENTELIGELIGCFNHRSSAIAAPDLSLTIEGTAAAQTVDKCISACLEHYFRYTGIWNGHTCLCGSSYGSQGAGNCEQKCYGNSSQICGGMHAVTVYATGYAVPGPPKKMWVNKTSDSRIDLQWDPPVARNGELVTYKVQAVVSETYSRQPLGERSWSSPASVNRTALVGLNPATYYNISLSAINQYGEGLPYSILVWTEIAAPNQPEMPQVVKSDENTITVRLKPVNNDYGPVSKYRLVVLSEDGVFSANSYFKDWDQAQKEGLSYYITAELDPHELNNETLFVVGDGRRYGRYMNHPLAPGHFHVSLGVVSEFQGVTKAAYSSTSHSQHGHVVLLDVPPAIPPSDGLTVFLKTAIAVCACLLVLAIVVFVILHRRFGGQRRRNRRRDQELNIVGAVSEVPAQDNTAFIFDEYLPEEEDKRVDYYDMLHQRIWNIPRNSLEIQVEVLGEGSFGTVYRGSVQRKGETSPVAIYSIRDRELPSDRKRSMLEGLDLLVRGADHPNVISLTGTCESQDITYVVFEHEPASLKDMLLQSRCLQHADGPQSRFCSLAETLLFDFIVGVARGMSFLASKRIVHKQLTCENVLMADGWLPKITGFGIAHYNRKNRKQDFNRWSALEVLTRNLHVTKSDVWSFGVVMWEVCTIGGTPYGELSRDRVRKGVQNGLRLPQPDHVGDCLYQLMLQCWQIDLDERPAFPDIIEQLDYIRPTVECKACRNVESVLTVQLSVLFLHLLKDICAGKIPSCVLCNA